MPRRELLRAIGVAGAAGLAGCAGDTPEPVDDSSPEEETLDDSDDDPDPEDDDGPDPEDDESPGPEDDESPDPEDDDQRVELTEDFDSYISDTWVRLDDPQEGILIHEMTTEWDLANDRVYRRVETSMEDNGDDEFPVMEYYMIGDTTYQLFNLDQESQCTTLDGRLISRDELREAGIRLPDAQDIEDGDADNLEQLDPTDVDGEPVEVWQFDLGETVFAHDGEMTVYVSSDTGYVMLIESWYDLGQADNPTTIEFEQRNHSFDEELDIELPDACEE